MQTLRPSNSISYFQSNNLFVTFGDGIYLKQKRSDSRYAILFVTFGDYELLSLIQTL